MKIKLAAILFLTLPVLLAAQPFGPKHQRGPRERIDQLEKIKLLEVLNLSEEESVRFFSRRDAFKEEHRKLLDERDEVISDMEIALTKEETVEQYEYDKALTKLGEIEEKILTHRKNFLNSLTDIMSIEEIAKFVVFESKFMDEVRNALMRRRGRR